MPESRIWSHCCGKSIALLGVVIAQGKVEVHTNVVGTKSPEDFKLLLKIKNRRYLYAIFV